MHDDKSNIVTRPVVLDPKETRTELLPHLHHDENDKLTLGRLAENFDDIIKSRAIFYPVSYRFIREMGRGQQGVVYQVARHGARGCTTQHAIKLFDPRLYRSPREYWTDMGRIAEQITRMHTINNPYLVSRQIYEEMNGVGYIQMDIIQGLDIQNLISGRHLETIRPITSEGDWKRFNDVIFRRNGSHLTIQPGIALFIIRSALRGLEPLHENGFLHSDIKPSNIMIDQTGYVKIIDFGRAVRIHEPVRYLFGTPLYMAPELHRRDPSTIRSDLYSIGLVMLELLRGKPLIAGDGLTEKDLLEAKLKLPDKLCSLLPQHVATNDHFVHALRKLTAPEPEDRFTGAVDAEAGPEGLQLLHRQLTLAGKDTQYDRELEYYLQQVLKAENNV